MGGPLFFFQRFFFSFPSIKRWRSGVKLAMGEVKGEGRSHLRGDYISISVVMRKKDEKKRKLGKERKRKRGNEEKEKEIEKRKIKR